MAIAAFVEPEREYEPPAERLFADRILRVWQITEHIAANPGRSRKELAAKYAVSERQLQSDLNVIKRECGLPLERQQGYRFVPKEDAHAVTLADIELLLLLLDRAQHDPFLPPGRVQSLIARLPSIVPPIYRPLVTAALCGNGRRARLFAQLAHAVVAGSWVRLEYPLSGVVIPLHEPIVRPEVILPYSGHWYVIGQCRQRGRLMVFPLDPVTAVSAA